LTGLNITKIVSGKKVAPKKQKKATETKAFLVRLQIKRLNAALVRTSVVLTKLHERTAFTPALQEQIDKFTRNVVLVLDGFPKTGERIPAKFFKSVQLLKPIQEKFISGCQQDLPKSHFAAARLAIATRWLADRVHHFARDVEKTYSSIPAFFDGATGELLQPSAQNVSNRHRDPLIESIFLEAMQNYRNVKVQKKIMPYKFFLRQLEQAGLTISERTFGTLKNDYASRKFGKKVR